MTERVARFTVSRALVEEFDALCGGFRPFQSAAFQGALDEVLSTGDLPTPLDARPVEWVNTKRHLRPEQWARLDALAPCQGDKTRFFRTAMEHAVAALRGTKDAA